MVQESAFYHRALGLLFKYSGLPTFMFNTCAASVCSTRFKVRIPIRDPRARFYEWTFGGQHHNSITISGTTFSGNPLRTTLGNSMRVYAYLQYYARAAAVHITPFVAGDDCLVIVNKSDA